MRDSKKIYIQGIVQGVGFRPFIFKLARKWDIKGWVHNDSFGVTIEAESETKNLNCFINEIRNQPPVLAQITDIQINENQLGGYSDFKIRKSKQLKNRFTLISPDISVCDDCLRELYDSSDRRYQYPFINCTNCGPRFTIVRDIPYDRPNTTMSKFPMCPECTSEYEDPGNRRFHAQPNACPNCGPGVWLTDNKGQKIPGDPILLAAEFLRQGKIIAIKGLGGFHLAVDATSEAAVSELRLRKKRYEKPLALMSPDSRTIKQFAFLSGLEKEILESPQRPICLLLKKKQSVIAHSVSPDNDYFGVMLPYTPLHYLIFKKDKFVALVMTSGNISDEPITYRNEEVWERLSEVADYFLINNRDIYQRSDDSVVRLMNKNISYIRRSRGFVPIPVVLKKDLPSVLAAGGELKNVLCTNKEKYFFMSQHIGDLENIDSLEFFEQSVHHLQKILEIKPEIIAYDLHPEYLSTKWALNQNDLPVIGIQHHHAHVAAGMAENGLTGQVTGFALDGTGYGPDGTIWGGEILMADETEYHRIAHFDPIVLPGGEAAIKEPWRMAYVYCSKSGIELNVSDYFPDVTDQEFNLVKQMIQKNINCPLTSSCGRLFDAVAALIGLRYRVGYEGQAAMQLEAQIQTKKLAINDYYEFLLFERDNKFVIDWRPVFQQLITDIEKSKSAGIISIKFHLGLVDVLLRLAKLIQADFKSNRIVLSGGCFQNRFLTEKLITKLTEAGLKVFYHTRVPPNDGGISLGQAYIASHILQSRKANEIY